MTRNEQIVALEEALTSLQHLWRATMTTAADEHVRVAEERALAVLVSLRLSAPHAIPPWECSQCGRTLLPLVEAAPTAPTAPDAEVNAYYAAAQAATVPAPPDVNAFVERCREIRNGSPNAFYAHVDKFCKAWFVAALALTPPCPACVSERGKADQHCRYCGGTGVCPFAAPAPTPPSIDWCRWRWVGTR